MAEYRKRDFSQFARDFFLYSTYFPLYLNERDSFKPKIFMLHTKSVVFEISSGFNTKMRQCVFDKTKDVVLKTDEDLLRFLVPRCIKIIHPLFHHSLIVAMAFIHEFLLYIQMNRLCYRFHFTAYKCLLATFQREYQNHWDMMDGWEGFQDEVKENIMKIRPHDRLSVMFEFPEREKFHNELMQLFENCNSVDGGDFVLNDYELALIAEDNAQGTENDPGEVGKDSLKVNLKPSRGVMTRKVKAFYEGKDNEFGIPISSLLPIPPYSKPEVEGDLETDPSDSDLSSSESYTEGDSSDGDSISSESYTEGGSSDGDLSSSESYPDIEIDYSYDDDYESWFETRLFSDFEVYTSVMMSEALSRHGAVKFREKMMKRKCENCGIRCYKFSYDLFKKQLHSAVVRNDVA